MEKSGIVVQCGASPEDATFEHVARQVEVTTAVLAEHVLKTDF